MKYLTYSLLIIALIAGCKKETKQTVPVISTTTPSNISSYGAQTGGNITNTGGSAISQSGICWALHNNPSVSDSIIPGGISGSGAFVSTLSNLNANTRYYVRAFAINATGTAYGNVDSFSTSAGLPTITTTAISNNSALMATSGWTLVNNGGASITAAGVCWSTSQIPTTSNFKTSDGVGLTTASDTLSNLNVTTYYIRAYATNSFGTAYGNQVTLAVNSTSTVTDIDGNSYTTVVIGTQTWMGSNLKTTRYQNGDPIPNGLTGITWASDTLGAYTFPHGDSTTNTTYGKLYSVFAVNDHRNVCPLGWHVPSDGEWETLEYFEGMAATDTGTLNARGTIGGNLIVGGSTGLNLQNAGILFPINGSYYFFGTKGYFWSSTVAIPNYNYVRGFNTVSGNTGPVWRNYVQYASSVRCVKN